MRDSDPRPMPDVVKTAYYQPMDLCWTLGSSVYRAAEQKLVRDALLEALIRDKGNVHFPHGPKQTRTITQRALAHKSPMESVKFILSVPDYGGEEQTLPYLARVMEPRWQSWWSSFSWSSSDSISSWGDSTRGVLGHRQYVWLAAQYARVAIGNISRRQSYAYMKAIDAAEMFALDPSVIARGRALDAVGYFQLTDASYFAATSVLADPLAGNAFTTLTPADSACAAAYRAIEDIVNAEQRQSIYARLCELTRQMITPSLLDAR